MTLHKYLYCLNDAVNKTDPTGEIAIGGFVGDTIAGLEAYYTDLDMGLQMAGGSWEGILDVAISTNTFRETYFSYKAIRRPVELVDLSKALNSIYNVCDWGGLGNCLAQVAGGKLWSDIHGPDGVPGALADMGGTVACIACAAPATVVVDKAITCPLCGVYLAYHAYSWYQIGNQISECAISNCGR